MTINDAFRLLGGLFTLVPLINRCKDESTIHEVNLTLQIIQEYANERSYLLNYELCDKKFLRILAESLEKKAKLGLINSEILLSIIMLRGNVENLPAKIQVEKYILMNFNIWKGKTELYNTLTSSYSYYPTVDPIHLFSIFDILFLHMNNYGDSTEEISMIQASRGHMYAILKTIKD